MAKQAQELVYVDPRSTKALQDFARKTKALGKGGATLRRELTAEIRKATAPLERDIKAEARGLQFRGTAAGQRARRTSSTTKTGRTRKGKGMREALEAGIKTEVSYRTGAGAGVRIRLKSSDAQVNRFGAALSRSGKVRHPTRTGPRFSQQGDKWADTVAANGKGWFYRPVDKHESTVRAGVKAAVDAMLNRLARG